MKPIADRIRAPLLRCAVALSLSLAACAAHPTPAAAPPVASGDVASHRVVIEVSVEGADKWEGLLNNVENLRASFGADQAQIEVVCHGKGLAMLVANNEAINDAMRDRLTKLAGGGVTFAACQNTMRKQNVKKEDLFPFAIVVDSGVAEVVRKQEAGFAYIKGGG